jgi:hypothetical protein
VLELPKHPGPAERELNTKREASYIIAVKNPTAPTPSNAGLSPDHEARFPKHLLEKFAGCRWVAVDPPDFLDYEGTELVLIGARENAEEEPGSPALQTARVMSGWAAMCAATAASCSGVSLRGR